MLPVNRLTVLSQNELGSENFYFAGKGAPSGAGTMPMTFPIP